MCVLVRSFVFKPSFNEAFVPNSLQKQLYVSFLSLAPIPRGSAEVGAVGEERIGIRGEGSKGKGRR